MSKKAEDVSSAVFLNKVDSFAINMTAICKRYLENAPNEDITTPNGEKEFSIFFKNFGFKDDGFLRFIASVARFGSSFPTKSYEMFTESFPTITASLTTMPKLKDTNRISFIQYLQNVDWTNPTTKTLIFLLIQLVFSEYLAEMLPYLTELPNDKILYFLKEIISFISSDCITNSNLVRKIIAESRIRAIYYLTKLSPEYCFDKIFSFVTNSSSELKQIYFKIFSSLSIGSTLKSVYMESLAPTLDIIQKSTNLETIIAATEFFTNVLLQIISQNPSMAGSSVFQHIYDDVKKLATESPENYAVQYLFAALTNFIFSDKLRTADEYYEIHIKQFCAANIERLKSNKVMVGYLCKKLAVKLRGNHYEPPVVLNETHNDLRWSCDIENADNFYQGIKEWLLEYAFYFTADYQNYAEFFKMLFVVSPEHFMKYLIPICSNVDYIPSIASGLFSSIIYIFSTNDQKMLDKPYFKEYKIAVQNILLKKLKICNVSDQAITFDMNSFSEALLASIDEKPIALRKIIATLRETSFPFQIVRHTTKIENQIAKELQMFENGNRKVFKIDQSNSFDWKNGLYSRRQVDEELAVHCALYVDPQADLINAICNRIFSESIYTVVLAIRALQAIIHINKKFSEMIFNNFYQSFFTSKKTFASIISIIVAMINIIETAKVEESVFSSFCMKSINFIMVIGLCVPHPQLRERLFKVAKVLGTSKSLRLTFIDFIAAQEEQISSLAISNALSFTATPLGINKSMLPKISFSDVLESNHSSLYLFYLSSLGSHLANSAYSTENREVVTQIMRFLLQLLMGVSKKGTDNMFIYNTSALLFAIADIYEKKSDVQKYFATHRIEIFWSEIIQRFKKETDLIHLAGIISNTSLKIFPAFATILSKRKISFQYILAAIICLIARRKDNDILDEQGHVTFIYYNSLYNILLTLIREEVIPKDIKFCFLNEPKDDSMKGLISFFGDCLKEIFQKILMFYKVGSSVSTSSSLFCHAAVGHLFDNEVWFSFFCNITSNVDAPYLKSMTEAFALWMRISNIPRSADGEHNPLQLFTKKILEELKYKQLIYVACFAQHPEVTILDFMEKARSSFSIFCAISEQIHLPNNLINQIQRHRNIEDLAENLKANSAHTLLYYQNCGRLMALCFIYLAQQSLDQRQAAMNFLEKLVFIGAMYRSNTDAALSILPAIASTRSVMISSFSVFIQKEIFILSSEIAKHFGFLSEQFAREIFITAKFLRQKRIVQANKTNSMLQQRRLTQMLRQRTKTQIGGQVRHSSQLKRMGGPLMENIDVNTPEILIEIMPDWLTPLSFDLQRSGISSRCENQFKCYTLMIFLEEVLSLVSILGMIQPIAVIIDEIIDRDMSFLIYALLNIHVNGDDTKLKKSATNVLVYIFSKTPEKFTSIIVEYLDVSTWFFYNVQNAGEVDEKTRIHFGEQEELYTQLMDAVLNVILKCHQENAEAASPLIQHIILYCSIIFAQFLEDSMVEDDFPTICEVLKTFGVWVDNKTLPNFRFLVMNNISSHDILMWGLCCGELAMSSTALQMFYDLGYSIDASHIPAFLRAMQIVAENLAERSDSSKETRFQNYLSFMHFENRKINLKPATNYLTISMQILERYMIEKGEYPPEIFNAAIQFMKSTTTMYTSLYSISIKVVLLFITNEKFVLGLPPDTKFKLLDLILAAPDADQQVLLCMRTILITCIEKRWYELLSRDEYAPIVSLFALVPFMWGRLNNIQSIHSIAEYYARKYDPRVRNIVNNAISGQSRAMKNIENLWAEFSSKITSHTLNKLLHFYAIIAKSGDSDQRDAVFLLTSSILSAVQNVHQQKDLSTIAFRATEVDASSSNAVLTLLHSLVKYNVSVEESKPSLGIQKFHSVKIFSMSKINKWKPTTDDVFHSIDTIPPIFVSDPMFLGSEVSEKQKAAIDRVSCNRLTRHADSLSRAMKQGKVEEGLAAELHVDPLEFLTSILDSTKEAKSADKEKVTKSMGIPIMTATPDVFISTPEEMNEMCKGAVDAVFKYLAE